MNPGRVIVALWVAFALSWFGTAWWSSTAVKRAGAKRELGYRLAAAAGGFLFAIPAHRYEGLLRLWHVGRVGAWACAGVMVLGYAFCWWARVHLGTLWSPSITKKAEHRIVDTGPYGIVRHPIYTGLLLAVLATLVAKGTVLGIAGGALLALSFVMKARLEERWLREELGAEAYDAYRRRVPMLLPIRFSHAAPLLLLLAFSRAAFAAPQLEVQEFAATGSMPKGVTLTPDGTKLYVTNFGQRNGKNISIYEAETLAHVADIDVPGIVVESVFNADGSLLYASNFDRDSVQVIDTRTRRVVREIHAGLHPKILALSKDGKTLFAANWNGNSVSEIDLARGVTVRTHPAGLHPRGMALTSRGFLYVANFDGETIDVFHGPGFSENYTLAACRIPRHLVLAPDERTLYLSCYHDSQLWALDLTGPSERANHIVNIGKFPKSIDVSRDGKYVYSADYGPSNSVSIVDTGDWSASTYTVPGMDRGSGITVLPGGRRAAVTGWCDNHVYIVGIQGSGGHPAETLAKIGRTPHGHCTTQEPGQN